MFVLDMLDLSAVSVGEKSHIKRAQSKSYFNKTDLSNSSKYTHSHFVFCAIHCRQIIFFQTIIFRSTDFPIASHETYLFSVNKQVKENSEKQS